MYPYDDKSGEEGAKNHLQKGIKEELDTTGLYIKQHQMVNEGKHKRINEKPTETHGTKAECHSFFIAPLRRKQTNDILANIGNKCSCGGVHTQCVVENIDKNIEQKLYENSK